MTRIHAYGPAGDPVFASRKGLEASDASLLAIAHRIPEGIGRQGASISVVIASRPEPFDCAQDMPCEGRRLPRALRLCSGQAQRGVAIASLGWCDCHGPLAFGGVQALLVSPLGGLAMKSPRPARRPTSPAVPGLDSSPRQGHESRRLAGKPEEVCQIDRPVVCDRMNAVF